MAGLKQILPTKIMETKTYKLFGVTILTITTYGSGEEPTPKSLKGPVGEILDYSPEEAQRDKDKKIINKMQGK